MGSRSICGWVIVRALILAILLAGASGCYYLQTPTQPMDYRFYPAADNYRQTLSLAAIEASGRQEALLVLLPGMGDKVTRFAKEGLIEQVTSADMALDVVVADAHFAYYRSRTFLERLEKDILQPAVAAGYQHIYLGGVSLGGFGGLLYWRHQSEYPESVIPVEGLLLLTPYVGEPEFFAHRLNSDLEPQASDDEKNIWPWLESLAAADTQHWYLGMAKRDEFYQANKLFSEFLLPEHIKESAGGHNWHSWRELWPAMLNEFKRAQMTAQGSSND